LVAGCADAGVSAWIGEVQKTAAGDQFAWVDDLTNIVWLFDGKRVSRCGVKPFTLEHNGERLVVTQLDSSTNCAVYQLRGGRPLCVRLPRVPVMTGTAVAEFRFDDATVLAKTLTLGRSGQGVEAYYKLYSRSNRWLPVSEETFQSVPAPLRVTAQPQTSDNKEYLIRSESSSEYSLQSRRAEFGKYILIQGIRDKTRIMMPATFTWSVGDIFGRLFPSVAKF